MPVKDAFAAMTEEHRASFGTVSNMLRSIVNFLGLKASALGQEASGAANGNACLKAHLCGYERAVLMRRHGIHLFVKSSMTSQHFNCTKFDSF